MASEFHLFTSLPTELRLRIFSLSLTSAARTIPLSCTRQHQIIGNRKRHYPVRFKSEHKAPPLLYVNRESRSEALDHYARLFKDPVHTRTDHGFIQVSQTPPEHVGCINVNVADGIFFRPDTDTLWVNDNTLTYVPTAERPMIQYMQVVVHDVSSFFEYHWDELTDFVGLKELNLYAELDSIGSHWRMSPQEWAEKLESQTRTEMEKCGMRWKLTVEQHPQPA